MAYFSDRIVSFPKLVIAAAAIYAGAVTLAHAELVCNIQDKGGNQLTYVFGPNTTNTQATFGTLVEKSFRRNSANVVSDVGQRPVWLFSDTVVGRDIISRANPGSTISTVGKGATLTHNGRFAGAGSCEWTDAVGDQGL